MKSGRSARCWCCAPRSAARRTDYPNLTVKKIPKQVLARCEWGHDDYSLKVENLPQGAARPKPGTAGSIAVRRRRRANEPPRQRHRRPPEPAPAAAPLAGNPRPRHGDRAAEERRGRRGRAGSDPQRVSDRHGLRARVPVALLRAGHRRRQDAADGRVHQLSAPGARHQQLLRAGAEPDDLQQADRRLHAEHAEVRVQGHRRVRHRPAGDHHRRQLRSATARHAVRRAAPLQGQHLQHLEDQLRSARRQVAAHQAAFGIHRRELLRLSGRTGRPGAAHGRVAPLPRVGRRAGDQRTEADPRPGTDGDAVRRNEQGPVPFKNVIFDYPLGAGDGGRLREGAGRRHAQEFQPGRHVRRGDRATEAGRRRPPAREREGRAGDLRPRERQPHRQAVRAGDRARHDARRAVAAADPVGRRSSRAATRTRSSRSIPARPARKKTR